MRLTQLLDRDEIRALTRVSTARGLWDVASTWAVIAAAFALVAWHPAVWTVLVAVVVLGGRQLALAVLMHEGAHRTLCRSPALNDAVGAWLCGAPVWVDLRRYRTHHLSHHAFTGTERDPDLDLVAPFPVSRRDLLRKLARDVTGLATVRRVVGLTLMDLGFYTYTASVGSRPADPGGVGAIARNAVRHLGPVALTNAALLGVLAALGHPALYLLWLAAYATTFSVFLRVRAIAEHACTAQGTDRLHNTRSTHASWLARVTVAPLHVNLHLEHHLFPTAPHYRLPVLRRVLEQRGLLDDVNSAPGYLDVLRRAAAAG